MDKDVDFNVEVVAADGAATLTVTGEVDVATAPGLWSAIAGVLGAQPTRLVFEIGDLRFIDSSGLSVIVRAYRELRASGGQVVIRHPSDAVRQVFDIAGLGRIMTIED